MPKKYLSPKFMKLAATLLIFLLLVFLNPKNFFDPVRNIFFTVSYPFQKSFYLLSMKISKTLDFLKSISDLKKENNELIKENNYLSAEIAKIKDEKNENELLREQLGLVPKKQFDLESAFVIDQDPQKLGSWLMIDKGSTDGVEKDMPVIVSDGILVGKIEEVYAKSAKVNLLTDSNSSINAYDLETNSKGIVKGEYGLGVLMDMVAQTDILNAGDTVVTSGLGSNVPKGLLIGRVQEIKNSADKLFQQALISPRVKYSKLDVVFVIKNAKN